MSVSKPRKSVFLDALIIIIAALGFIAFLMTAKAIKTVGEISDRQVLLDTLPDAGAATPGQEAILDGRISASVPLLHDEFVAYRRERYGREWRYLDDGKQPLTVEAGTKVYVIRNDDYAFDRTISGWTNSRREDEPPTFVHGSIRIEGMVANGPVMAIGHVVDTGEKPVFQAARVVALSRATYAQRLAEDRVSQTEFGQITAILAALGLALGGWGVWRIVR